MINVFGYMCYLIILKWNTHFPDTSKAYSIINMLINNPLSYLMGTSDSVLTENEKLQLELLFIAVLMVPLMLFVKPIWLILAHKRK